MTTTRRTWARMEAIFWIAGLVLVALPDPSGEPWLSVCMFDHLGDWLGLSFCPGCGLGRAVAWLARGNLEASFAAHPLGIPAVGILSAYAVRLFRAAGSIRLHTVQ